MKTAHGREITFQIYRTRLGWIVETDTGMFGSWEWRTWRPTRKGCLRWIAAEKIILSTPPEVID